MTTQRVVPSWPEADEHLASWLQKFIHGTQDSRGVSEVLKGVDGDHDVCQLLSRRHEVTSILNTRAERVLLCGLEKVLADIYPNHPHGASSSHLYGINSFTAAEVDDNFPRNLGEEVIPH